MYNNTYNNTYIITISNIIIKNIQTGTVLAGTGGGYSCLWSAVGGCRICCCNCCCALVFGIDEFISSLIAFIPPCFSIKS